jgi:hypothetical protein
VVAALGNYGYAACTFALIPVLFFLKDKLAGRSIAASRSPCGGSVGCRWHTMRLSIHSP